jgi:hypothetical protein
MRSLQDIRLEVIEKPTNNVGKGIPNLSIRNKNTDLTTTDVKVLKERMGQ